MVLSGEKNMPDEYATVTKHLNKLINDAQCLIVNKSVSFAEAQGIADYITEIRQLLAEWASLEGRLIPSRPIVEDILILKDRSFEMEGIIKDIRNRLEREQRFSGKPSNETKE